MGEQSGCIVSSGIISARMDKAFLIPFSSVSLNVSKIIFSMLPPPLWNVAFILKVPPPNRRHSFRYAKCARQIFMCGGASAAGCMKVYSEITLPIISVKAVTFIPFLTPIEYEKPFIFQTAK